MMGIRSLVMGLTCIPAAYGGGMDIPGTIAHQGVIAVHGERFSGNGSFRFALLNANTNAYLWVNDGSAVKPPDAPAAAVSLPVVNGVYTFGLGDTLLEHMTAIPLNVFNANNRVSLRVWFDDGRGNGLHALSPDLPLTTSPYSQYAAVSSQVNIPGTNTAAVSVEPDGDVTVPAGLRVDSNTLYVDPTSDRVGMGTTTPGAKLEVMGRVQSQGLTANGSVGGTGFTTPTVWDKDVSNDLTISTVFAGDVTGDFDSTAVGNDSHGHTDATVVDHLSIDNGRLYAPGPMMAGLAISNENRLFVRIIHGR